MCSVQEDIEELNVSNCSTEHLNRFKKFVISTKCKKCGDQSVVLLQKKDPLCRSCFMTYCSHKFRATIGKTKKIKPSHKVLLAYSGNASSCALLHMVKQALDDASHKRLLFSPGVLHIDESLVISQDFDRKIGQDQLNLAINGTQYPVIMSSIEMAFRDNDDTKFYWEKFQANCSSEKLRLELTQSLKSIKSLSAKQDFLECLRMQLMTDIAKHAGYTHLFVGDSATNLAIRLLSNIAMGRGSQISSNTNFYDARFKVPVCKPMREFLNKEIAIYNHLNGVSYVVKPTLLTKTNNNASIQRLTETFVCGLQENFPATIFTIFRTGGKLSFASSSSKESVCLLCKSKKDNVNPDSCSAIESLSLSATLSKPAVSRSCEKSGVDASNSQCCNEEEKNSDHKCCSNGYKSLNNLVLNYLCHGCQITVSEMENSIGHQPYFIQKMTEKISRAKMREEIKDFLLDNDDDD